MRWECWYRRGHQYPQSYRGHVLERAMEIIDSESSTPWVGWRCVDCGDRFALPGEPDRYDLPLMEHVETEDLPTDDREAAALALAVGASHRTGEYVLDAIRDVLWMTVPESQEAFDLRWKASRIARDEEPHLFGREHWALAEAILRTGVV